MRAIMLTGYPTRETAQTALKLGAIEYCVKPIDNDELEEKVTRVLVDVREQRMEERHPNSEFGMRNAE
jgi:ActR/RegA family two-component response regulator